MDELPGQRPSPAPLHSAPLSPSSERLPFHLSKVLAWEEAGKSPGVPSTSEGQATCSLYFGHTRTRPDPLESGGPLPSGRGSQGHRTGNCRPPGLAATRGSQKSGCDRVSRLLPPTPTQAPDPDPGVGVDGGGGRCGGCRAQVATIEQVLAAWGEVHWAEGPGHPGTGGAHPHASELTVPCQIILHPFLTFCFFVVKEAQIQRGGEKI